MVTQKIRPPTHSSFKNQEEADLPDTAKASDPGRFTGLETREATSHITEATRVLSAAETPSLPPEEQPNLYEGEPEPKSFSLTPEEAAIERARVNEPNRAYGKPFAPNYAEQLLLNYNAAFEKFSNDYRGTRNTRYEEEYLRARAAMVAAGLMEGE